MLRASLTLSAPQGMERDEVDKFTETATWRMQLERRLRVSSMLTSYFTLQAFEASRLLNIFWGVGLVVAGDLEPTRLLMAVINLQQVVSECSNGVAAATFFSADTTVAAHRQHEAAVQPAPAILHGDGAAGAAGGAPRVAPQDRAAAAGTN